MITKSGAGGNFSFTYDYENRLVGISGAATASYTYDYMGRRSSKNVGGVTTFLYDGQDLIAERGISVGDYIFGSRIDEPLAMRRSSTTYYFDVDALGSANLLNNSSGTVQNKYVFDTWGVTRSQTVAVSNPFGYTSREFAEAGMLFYRTRYYNPNIAKFGREDPIGWYGGINWFAYTGNNPVRFIDPSGLEFLPNDYYDPRKDKALEEVGDAIQLSWEWLMRRRIDRDIPNSDKWYHCMAHCEASRLGPDAKQFMEWSGEMFEEWYGEFLEEESECNLDRSANDRGRNGDPNTPCDDVCGVYRALAPDGWYPMGTDVSPYQFKHKEE